MQRTPDQKIPRSSSPLTEFDHLDSLARSYIARFLHDGSCLDDALAYSDQAKAQIPPGAENRIFPESNVEGFGDRYVSLRVRAWRADMSFQRALQLVEAIQWKFEVAPWARSLQDTANLGVARATIWNQTKSVADLTAGIQSCSEFVEDFEGHFDSTSDRQTSQERALYLEVLVTLSHLLYHEFRYSGQYATLESCIEIGRKAHSVAPLDKKLEIQRWLTLPFIANSFCCYTRAGGVPRQPLYIFESSYTGDEQRSSPLRGSTRLVHDSVLDIYAELPLSSNNSQIRLLELCAGDDDEPISCFLYVVSLQDCPEYDALSYVWGNTMEKESVILHGKIYEVTANLADALRGLRRPSQIRRLWVDALCINQEDTTNKEKEGQIRQMGRIYSQANTVCMWLGEPTRQAAFAERTDQIPCPSTAASSLQRALPGRVFLEVERHLSIFDDGASLELPIGAQLSPILHRLPFSIRPITADPYERTSEDFPTRMDNIGDVLAAFLRIIREANLLLDLEDTCTRSGWHQDIDRERPVVFDWDNELDIPSYLETKLSGLEWPICGAFTLIHLLAMDYHFHDLPFFGSTGCSSVHGKTAQAWNKSCFALHQILDSEYWTRAWILQEIILAQDPEIHFGKHRLSYRRLVAAIGNFMRHYETCCKDASLIFRSHRASDSTADDWWTHLYNAMRRLSSTSDAWLQQGHKRLQGEDNALRIMEAFLLNFKIRKATKLQDYVFSVLGLVEEKALNAIPVDYSMPVEEIFARTTARALGDYRIHDVVLQLAMQGRSVQLRYKLPSWCIDLAASVEWNPSHGVDLPRFNACGGCSADVHVDRDLCASFVSARIDHVARLSPIIPSLEERRFTFDKEIQAIQAWRRFASLSVEVMGVTNTEARFWTTFFSGCVPTQTAGVQSHEPAFGESSSFDLNTIREWQTWLNSPERIGPSPEIMQDVSTDWLQQGSRFSNFTQMLHSSIANKRFMITRYGRFASGPANEDREHFNSVEENDEIHLIAGCRVPVILRPIVEFPKRAKQCGHNPAAFSADLNTCNHNKDMMYQFVGLCYVDGVMHGEALKEPEVDWSEIFIR